jgi:hypothetical protein
LATLNCLSEIERVIHYTHLICHSNLRSDAPSFVEDTHHFSIRERLCSGADFKARRILSYVFHERKAQGDVGDYLL